MKKLFKPLSLLLAALLAAGSMVACSDSGSDELPTPEEIFDLVEKAKDAKITMEMEVIDLMTTLVTAEKDGDKAHTVTEVKMMGVTQTEEEYSEKKGDTIITYTKDGDEWTTSENDADEEVEDESSLEAFKQLFNSDNFKEFDIKSGKYVIKDDVTIEIDGMTLSEAYIKIDGNTFEIYAKIDVASSGISMTGELKFTIELTDVTVQLPKV